MSIKHSSGILKKYPSVVIKFKLLSNNDRIKLHWENHTSILPHIERDMIAVTGLPSILNQKEFQFVQNRKENCHHDHIPFNLKEDGNIVLWDDIYIPKKSLTLIFFYKYQLIYCSRVTHLDFQKLVPLRSDVEDDAVDVAVQRHGTAEQDQQHHVREYCSEVHHLEDDNV